MNSWAPYPVIILLLTLVPAPSLGQAPVDNAPRQAASQSGESVSGVTEVNSTAKGLVRLEPQLDQLEIAPKSLGEPARVGLSSQHLKLMGGIEEKNLAIEWDDWHNKIARAVIPRVFNNLGESLNVPGGSTTWIRVEITSDKHVKSVQVIKSSGVILFDRLVREAGYKLDGSYLLAFPSESKRTDVATNFAITKGGKGKVDRLVFGDVEYEEVEPGAEIQNDVRPIHSHHHSALYP